MGKIVFLDLDGTIKDKNGQIPESAVRAIRQARANGHEVCVSTGRTYRHIGEDVLSIGFDGIIANSGGYVEYHGETLNLKYFTQLAYIQLMTDLLNEGCIVEIEARSGYYVYEKDYDRYQEIRSQMEQMNQTVENIPSDPEKLESILSVSEIKKLLVFSTLKTGRELLNRWGYAFRLAEVHLAYGECWVGELTPITVNPAQGMRQILVCGDYSRKDSIAIGDSDNDVELLRYASQAVAMGDSSIAIQNAADFVTDAVSNDGLMKAFIHLGLI